MNARPRRRPVLWALLIVLLLASSLPPAGIASAATTPVCPVPAPPPPPCEDGPFWRCRHHLGTLKPTSVTSEGLSLFMMDPPNARIDQLRFDPDGCFTQIPLPWLPVDPSVNKAKFGSLVLGPRAFYAIVNFPNASGIDSYIPYLFRADRIPTAISGGWRLLRQTAGAADVGLSSVVMNRTVWMLRSCSRDCREARRKNTNAAFAVDWQPLATENVVILQPPGPTIDLGDAVQSRPAAGVTATEDALYVFGGDDTPTTATYIPLKSGTPGTPETMRPLPFGRKAATALIHGTSIYLVGGNDAGRPVVERGKIEPRTDPRKGLVRGHVRENGWERLPDPKLPPNVKIATATFARGQLWIVRDDGWIQTMDVSAVAPGKSRLTWDLTTATTTRATGQVVTSKPVPPAPMVVRRGDTIDLKLDWTYLGAQTFDRVSVELFAQPIDPGKRSQPFVQLVEGNFPAGTINLLPPSTPGKQISIRATIPTHVTDRFNRRVPDKRAEFNATVQLLAGGQRLGPIQRFRFVVERPAVR